MNGREVRIVDAVTIRRLFNDGGFVERAEAGVLHELIVEDGQPRSGAGQRAGARSQRLLYLSGTEVVAEVHRYVNRDDSRGGSGRDDPKMVVVDQVEYVLSTRSARRIPRRGRRR